MGYPSCKVPHIYAAHCCKVIYIVYAVYEVPGPSSDYLTIRKRVSAVVSF